MKLYGDRGSSNTRRVLATAVHIGIELDLELVSLFRREHHRPEFLALNPSGQIPVFTDDDVVLYEASAIMIYLAERFASDLLPGGNARYQTLKWMFWAAEHFRYGPPILIEERFFKKLQNRSEDPWIIDFAEQSIRKHSMVLNAHLEDRRFVAAEHVTLADFDLAAPFSHVRRTRAPFHEFPHLMAWHQRMLDEVPAWQITRDNLESRIRDISAEVGVSFD